MSLKRFPNMRQLDLTDCGPICLKIISKHYGKDLSINHSRKLSKKNREGVSLLGLSEAAEEIGFQTMGIKTPFSEIKVGIELPCVAYWNQEHFVVLYKITKQFVYVSDPAQGLVKYTHKEFKKNWCGNAESEEGVLLLLEPTDRFYNLEFPKEDREQTFFLIAKGLKKYKKLLLQVLLALLVGSILQLIFPFLTQAIIDQGISKKNLQIIYLLLAGQLFLFIGSTTIDLLRRLILMHISSRINIKLLSTFFEKVFRLPISFYDTRVTGDLLQRIDDHNRIENFLTTGTLNILFSAVNIIVFSIVLLSYDMTVFLIFIMGSLLFIGWVLIFMNKRSKLDYLRFSHLSDNSEKSLELINGMMEIKLNDMEIKKRWEWEHLQVRLFKTNLKGLKLSNWQFSGGSIINEFKNIIVTFYTATLVLEGELTLGMMLSIAYIIGQINAPIAQFTEFIQSYQDAKLSLIRINDIHRKEEEVKANKNYVEFRNGDILLKDMWFQYFGSRKDNYVLNNLNITIPKGKTTAIVGSSGSGKTTLLKLLLNFYSPSSGMISVGDINLDSIKPSEWRRNIGVVLQEGYIFPDSIANNISGGDEFPDYNKISEAARLANIEDYIMSLPMQYQSTIGGKGLTLSTGQKQRVLIARALYRNPDFLFFDEATSALDADNERKITENLETYLKGKTAVIIAHRLSTVKNADQILVIDNGEVNEVGTHEELITMKGTYYHLIKNQLELGS